MGVISKMLMMGLYLTIMVESITVGLAINLVIKISLSYKDVPPMKRSADHVMTYTFLLLTVFGHLTTVPCICYAAQRHKAKWLVPYLTWRGFLCFLVMLLAAYLCLVFPEKREELSRRERAYRYVLPVSAAEVLVGTAFFAIAFRAYKEMSRNIVEDLDKMY